MRLALTTFIVLAMTSTAQAYVGPGLGAGTIGVILGLLGSIFLAIFAIFFYPIKRFYKKVMGKKNIELQDAPVSNTKNEDG